MGLILDAWRTQSLLKDEATWKTVDEDGILETAASAMSWDDLG